MVIYLLIYDNSEVEDIFYASMNESKMDKLAQKLNKDFQCRRFFVRTIEDWSEDFDVEKVAEYIKGCHRYL